MATRLKQKVIRLQSLYGELQEIKKLLQNINISLVMCSDNANLGQLIGKYAREMPKFNILSENRKHTLAIIRKVCTYEISREDAYEILKEAENGIDYALRHFKL